MTNRRSPGGDRGRKGRRKVHAIRLPDARTLCGRDKSDPAVYAWVDLTTNAASASKVDCGACVKAAS